MAGRLAGRELGDERRELARDARERCSGVSGRRFGAREVAYALKGSASHAMLTLAVARMLRPFEPTIALPEAAGSPPTS